MSLIYLSCAWVAGIYLGSKFSPHLALSLTVIIPLLLLPFIRQHRKKLVLTSLCLLALFGGAAYFQSALPVEDEYSLQSYNGRTVETKGIIARDPDVSEKSTHLYFSATEIKLDKEWHKVSGTALIFVPRYPAYSYGDVLLVTGQLETPPRLLDDFDYQDYLAHQGIYSTISFPKIETLERGRGSRLMEWIYSLRNRLAQTMTRVLPEPQASLAQGIILGTRGNIPASLKDDFVHTGTAHILAISGFNLAIVAGMILSLGLWLFGRRRYIYVWLALGVIWLYALLTGMHPPVVRSAIMASLFLTAELLGRQRSAITALTFAAAVMVGVSPHILRDASFQLSFLAMAGLIFLFPPLQTLGRRAVSATLGEEGAAAIANTTADSFAVTLAAILGVWPVVAYYFGIISLAGLPATFLALPALPGIIVTGVIASSLGLFILPVAQAIGWLAWLFLSYLLMVVKVFAALPLSTEVGPGSLTLIWVYYPVLALTIWLSHKKRLSKTVLKAANFLKSGASKSVELASGRYRKWVIPPLLVVAVLVSVAAATMPDDRLQVSFLDVGQGDAILIQQGNQQVLVDGGPSPQAIVLELGRKLPFWDRTIDLVVTTHPNADHLTGLVEVLKRYRVEQVLYPDLDFKSNIYDEWLKLLREKNIKSTLAQAGQQVKLGEATMEVLNPPIPYLAGTESDIDNNGIVLHLSRGEVSFLLTADVMWQAEFELIADRTSLRSTVLKVAHHGSYTSTTPEFLAVVSPQIAVISAGKGNPFGHPSQMVMDRLKERLGSPNIYRTDELGTIEFITDGERLWVKINKAER